jgi:inorganic phosphate transporter, PiT family
MPDRAAAPSGSFLLDGGLIVVYLVVVFGLVFEFLNGFHDSANAIATVVATRVLPPGIAVVMAGALNLVGALSGTAVATTLGTGIVDPQAVTQTTVATALVSAAVWDVITWYYGLPTSSSHALIFSLMGAAVATRGLGVIVLDGTIRTSVGIVYSPLIGLAFGAAIMLALYWLLHRTRPQAVASLFGRLQLFSSAYMAFSHGGNDGQKTMGVIALALFSAGLLGQSFVIPPWVIVACAISMGLGTTFGGWRIIRTMAHRLVKLAPVNGFAAETAAGTVIELATRLGVPISTTHAVNGAILGVGVVRGPRGVGWQVAGNIVTAWILTIPICFVLGYLLMRLLVELGAVGLRVPGVR